jgi:protein-arginine kinase activator protein McsA
MTSEQNKVDQLTAFKDRDKFSDEAWNDRGLNPSANEVSSKLKGVFNNCADTLIDAVQNNGSEKALKSILQSQLSNFNQLDYDTEEREFICDLFFELSQILNIDFADNAMTWVYGSEIAQSMREQVEMNPPTVLDTIHQTCPNCGTALDTFIMRRQEGIPDFSWNIIQCTNCKDYSIVSFGPNVMEVRPDNYIFVEQLPKSEYSKEEAENRLEQIRHLKK